MIHLLTEKATAQQVHEMLEIYSDMIKIVVDIRRRILAGGSEMHYECEELLLEAVSKMIYGVLIGFLENNRSFVNR